MSSEIRNIIFDFGGVLFEIDYNRPILAFEALGLRGFRDFYAQAGQNEYFDRFESGDLSVEEFLAYLKGHVPHATGQEVEDAWNSILIGIMPEQVNAVKKMRDRGFRTFLLSNTNAFHVASFEKMIEDRMDMSDFRSAFEAIYYSNVIRMRKPHPETYLQICSWNGLLPSETLFIDDSIQHVEGARQAGLHAFHLKNGLRLDEELNRMFL